LASQPACPFDRLKDRLFLVCTHKLRLGWQLLNVRITSKAAAAVGDWRGR
jgi:hypothetical protein